MYVLDSNTVVYFLIGEEAVKKLITKLISEDQRLYIPTIVRLELFSKPDLSTENFSAISEFLRQNQSMDLDIRIADIAADIRRIYRLKTPDSVIAASAIYTNAMLITRNVRDFNKIEGLKLKAI
jgi:predicted nucleic acid-binding protein